FRRLTQYGYGERTALAHIDLVSVKLEDLFLAKPLLQDAGDQHLFQLAFDLFLRIQEKAARHLHGERGTTLLALSGAQVHPGRFRNAEVVHPAMLEEPP